MLFPRVFRTGNASFQLLLHLGRSYDKTEQKLQDTLATAGRRIPPSLGFGVKGVGSISSSVIAVVQSR